MRNLVLNTNKQKEIDANDENFEISSLSNRKYKIHAEFIPSNDEYSKLLKTSSFSGAGGILYSSFSYTGWKFPSLTISEIDEKYL